MVWRCGGVEKLACSAKIWPQDITFAVFSLHRRCTTFTQCTWGLSMCKGVKLFCDTCILYTYGVKKMHMKWWRFYSKSKTTLPLLRTISILLCNKPKESATKGVMVVHRRKERMKASKAGPYTEGEPSALRRYGVVIACPEGSTPFHMPRRGNSSVLKKKWKTVWSRRCGGVKHSTPTTSLHLHPIPLYPWLCAPYRRRALGSPSV